jgi:hypothetical protein
MLLPIAARKRFFDGAPWPGELQIPLVPNSDQSSNGLFANYLGLHVLPDRERSEFIIRYYVSGPLVAARRVVINDSYPADP